MAKTAVSLTTGLEDPEKVMIALLVAVGAAEAGRETLMFLTKEAVRLALEGHGIGTACDGCPPIEELLDRYAKANGQFIACGVCFNAKKLDAGRLVPNARVAGTVQLWEWIGDDPAVTFSY